MWGVGQDAVLRMTVGNLILLDRAPTRSALAERLGVAAEHVERLRQRPDGLPSIRMRPTWVDEEAFDAADHIRSMAVPSPGDHRQLLDLVALLEPSPFDPSMSPWDVTVIEGLDGGAAALYLRAHHSLMDGSHGVSFVRSILDEHVASTDAAHELESHGTGGDVRADRRDRPVVRTASRDGSPALSASPSISPAPSIRSSHRSSGGDAHRSCGRRRACCPTQPRCCQFGLSTGRGDRWSDVATGRRRDR